MEKNKRCMFYVSKKKKGKKKDTCEGGFGSQTFIFKSKAL